MNQAVFLDRDGVITQEPPYYAHRIDELEFIQKYPEAKNIGLFVNAGNQKTEC